MKVLEARISGRFLLSCEKVSARPPPTFPGLRSLPTLGSETNPRLPFGVSWLAEGPEVDRGCPPWTELTDLRLETVFLKFSDPPFVGDPLGFFMNS